MADISSITLPNGDSYNFKDSEARSSIPETYAGSPSAGGPATITNGIHYAQVGSASTSKNFIVTIPGITEYYDGLTIMLKNGVVTSASGFVINVNNLGGKPAYTNLAAASAETTIFNINYTMMFVYDSTRVAGGGWICYRGYDSNTNTIGYQLRTNSSTMPMASVVYRYRLLFTSADGTKWVPANNSTSTNATASRTTIQTPIDPFGEIVYYGATASVAADANPAVGSLWQQYTLSLGYSFNRTGAELVLQYPKPIYLKCAPQTNGSAIIDAESPYVQALPSTADGKIYIYLGVAYSATAIELKMNHPVYYYADGAIRPWVNQNGSAVTAMTDQEIKDAVDDAWVTVYGLDGGGYVAHGQIISVTDDGTYGQSAGVIEYAAEGATVTVMTVGGSWVPDFYRKDTSFNLTLTTVATNVYSFTMPPSDVMLHMIYDD